MLLIHKFTLAWAGIIVLGILVIVLTGGRTVEVECIDGSIQSDIRLCPQCAVDDDCDIDQVCNLRGRCEPKQCRLSSDCEGRSNSCIFNQCINTGADTIPV
ncbi:MAG: hypothetical protein ACMXYF_03910 [Candidatus Woesearchaeota archaeon]